MNLINPNEIGTKIILLIPIIICFSIAVAISKTDGNIIAGFNTLSEEKKEELRQQGYVEKTQKMTYAISVPLLISFVLSFIIKNEEIFNNVITVT